MHLLMGGSLFLRTFDVGVECIAVVLDILHRAQ